MPSQTTEALGVLWGKSAAGRRPGRPSLLLQHLLDSAAVGEIIWDTYLAPNVRRKIDACCGGQGRTLLALLCGLHDVGKATPAFQSKHAPLASNVRAAGLIWPGDVLPARDARWHHTLAGAVIVRDQLSAFGWSPAALEWVVALIAGHHGVFPPIHDYGRHALRRCRAGHGEDVAWRQAQAGVVAAVVEALGVDPVSLAPPIPPSRATQLAISGAIIMADWIASGDEFDGVFDLEQVSMQQARGRARAAWERLGIRGGWRLVDQPPPDTLMKVRFGRSARGVQNAAVEVAESMPGPGLMLVEAPTGEGKTEAALVAAEVLVRRFSADGVDVFMPTQATSDAMFERVLNWARTIDPESPVGLLHGKRRFNRLWRTLYEQRRDTSYHGIDDHDEYGLPDEYMNGSSGRPMSWFLGPKRGLLMPLTVATVDQLLYAATRTRHVMLRHLGLAGRVVVLDEVHAYDIYMGQFLEEALRWLADAGVPVILLSATLPPAMRNRLVRAYLQGVTRQIDPDLSGIPGDLSYPGVLAVGADGSGSWSRIGSAAPWRSSLPVRVEILDEGPDDDPEGVARLVADAVADGGRVLVVRNTVRRAQRTFQALRDQFPDDVVLLHARMCLGERVERVGSVVRLLGPEADAAPPRRLIVVATQVAEQSFDVDVDLLVTDIAPIDLVLQRVGRLHRHDRPDRPCGLKVPRVVITGLKTAMDAVPVFPRGSEAVYGRHPLLRAAALAVEGAARGGWSIPRDVPELVKRGYGDDALGPASWQPAMVAAQHEWDNRQRDRIQKAKEFLLTDGGAASLSATDLAGLHNLRARDDDDPVESVHAMVRDGDSSIEVVLLRRDQRGRVTLDGQPLGINDVGISNPDTAQSVLESAVRLPPRFTAVALRDLDTLTESGDDPWLCHVKVLELDDNNVAVTPSGTPLIAAERRLRYDVDLGLVEEPAP